MEIRIKIKPVTAEAWVEALTDVLDNCDIHGDDAAHLEVMRDTFEYHVEKRKDYMSDVEIY